MKNTEIERKFLVSEENLPDLSRYIYGDMTQGYVQNIGSSYLYRLRQIMFMSPKSEFIGDRYYQTIKGFGKKKRKEFEIELLRPQFGILWPLCENLVIHKFRYEIPLPGREEYVDLDVFKNQLSGLITAEVEFKTEELCDAFIPLPWFGREVTEDDEYSNFNLAIKGLPTKLI